jgi:trimethylamine--corrinoid protein Co-methyltransferase
MQKDYVYPEVADRTSPKEWQEAGKPVLLETARKRVDSILTAHYPKHVSAEIDTAIRQCFDIKLPAARMVVKCNI